MDFRPHGHGSIQCPASSGSPGEAAPSGGRSGPSGGPSTGTKELWLDLDMASQLDIALPALPRPPHRGARTSDDRRTTVRRREPPGQAQFPSLIRSLGFRLRPVGGLLRGLARTGADQPCLVRDDDGLDTVTESELGEDAGDVRLDGGLGQVEAGGEL